MTHMLAAIAAIGGKIVGIAVAVMAIVMVSYSGYVIYDSIYTNKAAFSSWDLSEYRPSLDENGHLSFEEMEKVNPDTVAWIKILGTNIDYPVVQGKDDLEYASKDVFGKNSLSGSIYLTCINSRDMTNSFNLIYGHHMENGAMFGDIEKYKDEDYFKKHQEGILVTPYGNYDLHVFARLSTDAYNSKIYSAGDRPASDFPDFLFYVKSLAVQWREDTDIYGITNRIQTYLNAREANIAEYGHFDFYKMPEDAIQNGMQLIALSTCADATTNGRQLLIATMTFRTEPLPVEMLADDKVPLAAWGHEEVENWALLNLVCVVMIIVILLPGKGIREKYRILRKSAVNKPQARVANKAGVSTEDGQPEKAGNAAGTKTGNNDLENELRRRRQLGIILEIAITVFSVLWFWRTENFHAPMVIVDRWTPLMVGLFAGMWIADTFLVRYRERSEEEDENNPSAQISGAG